MVDFRNKTRVETTVPIIRVDAGLPAGRYIVKLTVIDEGGNKSKPANVNLEITRRFPGSTRPGRIGRT